MPVFLRFAGILLIAGIIVTAIAIYVRSTSVDTAQIPSRPEKGSPQSFVEGLDTSDEQVDEALRQREEAAEMQESEENSDSEQRLTP